jgi:hypothetical protein
MKKKSHIRARAVSLPSITRRPDSIPTSSQETFAQKCADKILAEKNARMSRAEPLLRSDLVRIIDAAHEEQSATEEITVRLSAQQLHIFASAAAENNCTPGEAILALACSRIHHNSPCTTDADQEFHSELWRHVGARVRIEPDAGWSHAGFPVTKENAAP